MILLFTDYGLDGPYLGQVMTTLKQQARDIPVINLMASLVQHMPDKAIVFSVVDPGVGSDIDQPVAIRSGSRWYVGPDNGLFDIVLRTSTDIECWNIKQPDAAISVSFHGRDIYAPVCAMIANGDAITGSRFDWQDRHSWPDDLEEVIYIDHFGNAMTGTRAESVDNKRKLVVNEMRIAHAVTFASVPPGQAFWYCNSNGLVEISVNQGSAAEKCSLDIGTHIKFE